MPNKTGNRNKGAAIMMLFIALCMLISGLFFIVVSMIPADAASSVILLDPSCTPSSTHHCPATPTPTKTPKPTDTPSPTPSPTPKPTNTPNPTPTSGHNPPTPTPTQSSGGSIPAPTPTIGGPVPPSTATAQANQTSTPVPTTQSSVSGLPPGGPPAGGNSGGSSTGIVFTFAALALALVAFLLYLIPQGHSSMAVRLLSLVLPTSVARRFGAK